MPKSDPLAAVANRFAAFVAEAHPESSDRLIAAFHDAIGRLRAARRSPAETLDAMRTPLRDAVTKALKLRSPRGVRETTPGISSAARFRHAEAAIVESCDGFARREALCASLTPDERREILRGMILTRAVDNRLKAFFTGGEVRYGVSSFQGKGFRSLGQEAIYASVIRLRRGAAYRTESGGWRGDVIAPLIRDAGAVLAMRNAPETVRMILSAQMGKAGPPMGGKDLHVGEFGWGVLPASAPLTISTLTAAGLAMGFRIRNEDRVAITYIGEGGTSLGEWHEAINLCAARRLPAVFCVQNNQTALSTPVVEQSAVRVFADKAIGYGVPGVTIDGTDPDVIAATFAWAAERARAGAGPALVELVAMRMCGHAHHDDMLYLGKDPQPSWDYPKPTSQGYADGVAYATWAARDPIPTYAARLVAERVIGRNDLERFKEEAGTSVEHEARAVIELPWPDASEAGRGVFAGEPPRRHAEPLAGASRFTRAVPALPPVEAAPAHDPKGATFLEAITMGVGDALRSDPLVFVYGEDVGGAYGNAFLLLRPLLGEFADRIVNSPIAEAGVLGVCTGAALAGTRPIGEIQFNDFVATGFNQLVNNAAKIRYRWGGSVPMVVRMPWGGLRRAGPYHSQNTEAWFYRTPGLKIVCPSTPHDARALMAAAVADPDPVLYYEHIALYREPRIRQKLAREAPALVPLGRAALRRAGSDLAILSYGAYVHVALKVADVLAAEGTACSVLDLRTLAPLDRETLLTVVRHCGKALICHEDTRTGGIGESVAAVIQEECFEDLDAPVRIVGSLDTPAPYSPPLEDAYLPGEEGVLRAARRLAAY